MRARLTLLAANGSVDAGRLGGPAAGRGCWGIAAAALASGQAAAGERSPIGLPPAKVGRPRWTGPVRARRGSSPQADISSITVVGTARPRRARRCKAAGVMAAPSYCCGPAELATQGGVRGRRGPGRSATVGVGRAHRDDVEHLGQLAGNCLALGRGAMQAHPHDRSLPTR